MSFHMCVCMLVCVCVCVCVCVSEWVFFWNNFPRPSNQFLLYSCKAPSLFPLPRSVSPYGSACLSPVCQLAPTWNFSNSLLLMPEWRECVCHVLYPSMVQITKYPCGCTLWEEVVELMFRDGSRLWFWFCGSVVVLFCLGIFISRWINSIRRLYQLPIQYLVLLLAKIVSNCLWVTLNRTVIKHWFMDPYKWNSLFILLKLKTSHNMLATHDAICY